MFRYFSFVKMETVSSSRFINETDILISNRTDALNDLKHPVNALHLVERFVFNWLYLFEKLVCQKCTKVNAVQDFKKAYQHALHNVTRLPVMKDLNGTMRAMFRIWRTYKLDINKLLHGDILGYKARPLNHKQLVRLILFAAENPELYYEELVLRTKMTDILKGTPYYYGVVFELASAYYKHGFISTAKTILESLLPLGNKAMTLAYEECLKHPMVNDSRELKSPPSPEHPVYDQLCRGELKSPKALSKLHCRYRRTSIPIYWSKQEVLHQDPMIALYHDVISDEEIKMVLQHSIKDMARSDLTSTKKGKEEDVLTTSWLTELQTKSLLPLTRRIETITGLSTTVSKLYSDSENYEINNFGVGGMLKPHYDYLNISLGEYVRNVERSIRQSGDRVATWMFYLSNVEAGGATVFPEAKVRVQPVKGSALFWYNIKKNSEKDTRTLNADCPVLIGSKFVCRKWILEAGQAFRRKCGLSPFSTDES
ncbi:prolyl 4-hydroxylase subunit alpha-1-like [Crassostrea virginica]